MAVRIIVMSDSHGLYSPLEKIVERNLSAEIFIHLGDGEREVSRLKERYPLLDIRFVRGNCDLASFAPSILFFGVENKKVIAVHGSSHGVKYGLDGVLALAKENGADVVLFGHTHARLTEYEDGVHFLNPGSASCPRDGNAPSYGYVDITDAGIVTGIVDLSH